jgi:transcriptional regulator with XRE-family HTH domain
MYASTLTPLRFGRLCSGVPQYVLAKRAHLAPSRLSVLERGYDEPSAYERSALAAALGIPAEELFPILPNPATPAPTAASRASR